MPVLRTLSNSELVTKAEADQRYSADPLFTELVDRLGEATHGDKARAANKHVDAGIRRVELNPLPRNPPKAGAGHVRR